METMAHCCIDKLKISHPNNNQYWNNAAIIYPDIMVTTG